MIEDAAERQQAILARVRDAPLGVPLNSFKRTNRGRADIRALMDAGLVRIVQRPSKVDGSHAWQHTAWLVPLV